MWLVLPLTVVWNLLAAPLSFVVYKEVVEKENYFLLVFLPFPLVGIGLLFWSVRLLREWRRFGAAPLLLEPFPGSIGGHVGGTIDIRLPFNPHNRFTLTLSCMQCFEIDSDGSRTMHEQAQWQDELIPQVDSCPTGTRLSFCFDVPKGLSESDAEQTGERYNLWRLNVRGNMPGTAFDRSFNIPVYATASNLET